jgi:hypothetical protein
LQRTRKLLDGLEPVPRSAFVGIWPVSALTFLDKVVDEPNLRRLAAALLAEAELGMEERGIYRLAVSRTLEMCSGSQTDGVYKAPTSLKRARPFQESFERVLDELDADIADLPHAYAERAQLYHHSSEAMPELADDSATICVTSPPYLNNFDFAEMTRMELYFWRYASSWREITDSIRRKLIVNTCTAPTDLKRDQEGFERRLSDSMVNMLAPIRDELAEARADRKRSKDYDRLVFPYFAQMTSVLRESVRVLRPGSPMHIVVSDAALYGVHIHTEQLIVQILDELGCSQTMVVRLRSRGDRWILDKRTGSSEPLGEFWIKTTVG